MIQLNNFSFFNLILCFSFLVGSRKTMLSLVLCLL